MFHHLLQHLEPLKSLLTEIVKYLTILAVGWTTSIFWRIVAPSLVIKIYPLWSLIILSIPLGPRLVLTQSAMAELIWFYLLQLECLSFSHLCFFHFYCMMLALELWIMLLNRTSLLIINDLNIFKIKYYLVYIIFINLIFNTKVMKYLAK